MKSARSLEKLYHLIKNSSDPIEAKNFLSTTIYNIISEIHEEGLEVTEETIEMKLQKEIEDLSFVSKVA